MNLLIDFFSFLSFKVSKGEDNFDYVSWSTASKLEDIWNFFSSIEKIHGKKMINSALSEAEAQKMRNMINRLYKYFNSILINQSTL